MPKQCFSCLTTKLLNLSITHLQDNGDKAALNALYQQWKKEYGSATPSPQVSKNQGMAHTQ